LAAVVLLALALASATSAPAREPTDRLERFRTLAGNRHAILQLGGAPRSAEDEREIYALLDEEIVQNLASGGLFASEGFLQDRLEGFAEAWGGAAFRALRVGPLAVVACTPATRPSSAPSAARAARRCTRCRGRPVVPSSSWWRGRARPLGGGRASCGSRWCGSAAMTSTSCGAPTRPFPRG
jgi:hypothetical protein